MRKFVLLFLFLPLPAFAQDGIDTSRSRIVVTEDVNECVQKIHDNPDAIKLLMSLIMSDRTKMQQLRDELMNDPSFIQMMRDLRKEMHLGDNDMHRGMKEQKTDRQQKKDEKDPHGEMNTTESDTTGVK